MTIRAVVFDLFDTLVDLRFEDLPRIEHEGRWLPASAKVLHDAVTERAEVSFAAFIEAYLAAAGDGVLTSVGAYQLEGLGAHLFARIDGDYFTILGLPLLPLLDFLREHGIVPR